MKRYYVSPCDYEGTRSWCVMRREGTPRQRHALVGRDSMDVAVSEHHKRTQAREECARLNAQEQGRDQ